MAEQLKLLMIEESYNLANLRDMCRDFVKKKFPSPMEDEDFDEYMEFLQQEADLEYVARLRKIADEIEARVLNPMKKDIREVYKDLTNKTDGCNIK